MTQGQMKRGIPFILFYGIECFSISFNAEFIHIPLSFFRFNIFYLVSYLQPVNMQPNNNNIYICNKKLI